jgi:hypothetical protein
MEKEMKGALLDVANELRLAGSAIDDLSHTVSKAFSETLGDMIGVKERKALRDEAKALEDAFNALRRLSADCYKVSLSIGDLTKDESDD